MFKNFITSSLRSIKRQKLFSAINLLGLSVGISISLMLFLFINYELGYDNFHENGNRIHKVISKMTTNEGNDWITGITFGSVVPEAKKDIPEIESAARIFNAGRYDVFEAKTSFQNQRLYYADYDFFDVFSFPSIYGSTFDKPAFENKGVIISQKLAKLVFGEESPLGNTLEFNDDKFIVLDVVQVPERSHLQFDMIISLETLNDIQAWSYNGGLEFHSYILYQENTDQAVVNEKISDLYNVQMNERFQDFAASSDNYMMPFRDIYLKSEGISNNLATGSIKTIYTLGIINALILFIAIVNYINLTTAQYEKRIKEIGIRKVIGANRRALIFQFLGESVILTLIAFVISLLITQSLFKPFGELMQINASVTFWNQTGQLGIMFSSVVLLGILSGIYPALFISRFNPIKILKRDFLGFKKGIKGSKILVMLQFVIAIVLVTNLIFLNKQIDFVKNKELGFSKDQILVVNNLNDKHTKAYQSLKAEIASQTNVIEVTGAQSALGLGSSGQTVYLEGESANTAQSINEIRTMHNFINTHDIQLIKGRDFNPELVTDKDAFILNKSGESMMFPNGDDPIGKVIYIAGRKGSIVGVVDDFHYNNLKRKISPLVISLDDPYRITLSVKLNTLNIQESLNNIEKSLQNVDPQYRLGYYFLDDYFNDMFKAEERNATLISYSSTVAALISLIGLVALISHSLAKRIKEVAIRKVLGAHFMELLWVLAREFYLIILLANVIAIPLAIFTMGKWLDSFAYRISPVDSWGIFLIIGVFSFLIALGLILSQVIKRTRANPVEVLGNE